MLQQLSKYQILFVNARAAPTVALTINNRSPESSDTKGVEKIQPYDVINLRTWNFAEYVWLGMPQQLSKYQILFVNARAAPTVALTINNRSPESSDTKGVEKIQPYDVVN